MISRRSILQGVNKYYYLYYNYSLVDLSLLKFFLESFLSSTIYVEYLYSLFYSIKINTSLLISISRYFIDIGYIRRLVLLYKNIINLV